EQLDPVHLREDQVGDDDGAAIGEAERLFRRGGGPDAVAPLLQETSEAVANSGVVVHNQDLGATHRRVPRPGRPLSIRRISCDSVSGKHGFVRKASQPASLARASAPASAWPVTAITGIARVRVSRFKVRVTSQPSMPGIARSITTRSGKPARTCARVS